MSLLILNDRFDSEREAIALSAIRYGVSLWKIAQEKNVNSLLNNIDFKRLS